MPVLQLRLVLGPKNRELCVGYYAYAFSRNLQLTRELLGFPMKPSLSK